MLERFSLCSRLGNFGLGFRKLSCFKGSVIVKDSSFCKLYRGTSAALALDYSDDSVFGSDCGSRSDIVVPDKKSRSLEILPLVSVVVRVIKSLNWRVARKTSFRKAADRYGFSCSISGFRLLVHVFALAGMHLEVYALLRDIMNFYKEDNLDLFALLPTMLELLNHEATEVFLVDVLIKVFASNVMLEDAFYVYNGAKVMGIQPGIRSCNFLLKCMAEKNKSSCLFNLFEEMKYSGPFPNVYTYTIMLNFRCNKHNGEEKVNLEEAASIFRDMESVGICPSAVTYGIYIRGFCKIGHPGIALETIQKLRRCSQPLNVYCYNAIIHSFCKNGKPDEAWKVFSEMKSCGILPDVYSYSILIEGYNKVGDTKKALALFKEMKSDNSDLKPSLVTYTSLVKGLCSAEQMKSFAHTLPEFEKKCWYEYDHQAYNTIISGVLAQGNVDFTDGHIKKALEYLDEMRNRGMNPNIFSYGILMDRLCKDGKPETALSLVPLMLKRDVLPNVVVHSTLFHGFVRQAKLDKAKMVNSGMIKLGIAPNNIIWTILLHHLLSRGQGEQACIQFKEMILNGVSPDAISYTSMIVGLCKIGCSKKNIRYLEAALSLLKNMQQRGGLLPSVITYTCLADAFCKLKREDVAVNLVNEMRRLSICPDMLMDTVLKRHRMKL